jgi:hypothetical protein
MQKKRIPDHLQIWIDARKNLRLSHAQVQMARELGFNPKKFGKLANHKQEPWKVPLPQYIEHLYRKHYKKDRPENVVSIEEKARRAREAEIARAKHLDEIAGKEPELWNQIETLIATKQPKNYDRAVELLVDLRDLAARKGKKEDFGSRLDALRVSQARKPAFIEKMRKAGL